VIFSGCMKSALLNFTNSVTTDVDIQIKEIVIKKYVFWMCLQIVNGLQWFF